MRVKYSYIIALALALSFALLHWASAQQPTIRTINTFNGFSAIVGHAVTIVNFENLAVGSLPTNPYRQRGVTFSTDQPMQAHTTRIAPALSIARHIGAASTKILISDAIPVNPNALKIQFPVGTKAAGCFLVAAASETGSVIEVEVHTAIGAPHQVDVRAFADRHEPERRQQGPRRNHPNATFIGFISIADITSIKLSAAGGRRGTEHHNFGIDDIIFARR